MDNEEKKQDIREVMKEMNCRECGNWLCGANGMDRQVLCFFGYAKEEGEERHV